MTDVKSPRLILASASPRRLELLAKAGITPAEVVAADLDETPHKNELPPAYARRVAREKARAVSARLGKDIILAADTVVACGRRILPKAEDEKAAHLCLETLSGRRHRVYTAVCIMVGEKLHEKLVMTQVQFARLSDKDIARYIVSKEWHGKAGGYAIQGAASAFIPRVNGSVSNVIGLPLAETCAILKQLGIVW